MSFEEQMEQKLSTHDLVRWIKLITVKEGLGPMRMQKLLQAFSYNLEAIFNANRSELLALSFINEKIANKIEHIKSADESSFYNLVSICNENKITIMPYFDKRYPDKLRNIPAPPLTLYLHGNLSLLHKKMMVAIVGTREPSQKARDIAYNFSQELSDKGTEIISGGAFGIDTSAHRGALDSNLKETICVLGSGFFRPYPPENKELFDEIATKGLLVSENAPNFSGAAYSFALRNRITSGLSDAVFLVATRNQGGGMDQAERAYAQRKTIFVPKLSDSILPNEGIKTVIKDYHGIEIANTEEMLYKLKAKNTIEKYVEN